MASYSIQCVNQISAIGCPLWTTLMGENNPFSRYGFLNALEQAGCVGETTGWRPMHLVVSAAISGDEGQSKASVLSVEQPLAAERVLAVMPLYLKGHSYGEYVFDWAWAQAYERHGLDYYPKLINAIPFTPVTGPRIGFKKSLSAAETELVITAIAEFLDDLLQAGTASGWHSLFLEEPQRASVMKLGHLQRLGTQFHWFNRGYRQFEDFLAALTSRKRKSILKERRQVAQEGLCFRFVTGMEITADELSHFVRCYQRTYYKRSGHQGYLNQAFFQQLVDTMSDSLCLLIVERPGDENSCQPIAAALYFISADCLYGRYWGTLEEIDGLHFEACYYQGIEYAIAKGLKKFDAGAQGEHKVLRGFEPIATYSVHEIGHSGFRYAIADFLIEEEKAVKTYMGELKGILPYKEKIEFSSTAKL